MIYRGHAQGIPGLAEGSLELRAFDPEADLDEVQDLHRLVHGRALSREEWEWRYRPPWADGVHASVACTEDGVVGYVGAAPLPGWLNGQDTPFFQIQDVMVHPRFRARYSSAQIYKHSVLAILAGIHQVHPRAVVYGFAPRRPFLWYRRLGFATLIEPVPEFVVRPPQLHPDEEFSDGAELEIREWDWGDPNVDHVWQNLSGTISAGLRRDRAYLGARYTGHPERRYRLFGVLQGGDAAGWVIAGPLKDGEVLEEVWAPDLLLPRQLVRTALEETARTLGANSLITWLPSAFAPEFSEVREAGLSAVYIPGGFPLPTEYLAGNLYYTAGDVGV